MQDEINNNEFELSFDYKNVLYIAQVIAKASSTGFDYAITYFSPNGKGEIPVLKKVTMDNEVSWQEPAHTHEQEFIDEIGAQLEKNHKS